MNSGAQGEQKRVFPNGLELESQMVVIHPLCFLGTKYRVSASTLNHGTIF